MWTVWVRDPIDNDRIALADITHEQACRLRDNLQGIFPDARIWIEEE